MHFYCHLHGCHRSIGETERKKKKRNKKPQCVTLKEQEDESQDLAELVKVLEELEKERKVC